MTKKEELLLKAFIVATKVIDNFDPNKGKPGEMAFRLEQSLPNELGLTFKDILHCVLEGKYKDEKYEELPEIVWQYQGGFYHSVDECFENLKALADQGIKRRFDDFKI